MKSFEIEVPDAIYEFMLNTSASFDWNEYLLDKISDIMASYLDSHPELIKDLTANLKAITEDFTFSLKDKNDKNEEKEKNS